MWMQNLGVCGDDCSLCPRFIATQSGNIEELKKVAILWHRIGLRNKVVSAEEIACHGCPSSIKCAFEDVKKCAEQGKVRNCGECVDYPCGKIENIFGQTEPLAKKFKANCSEIEYQQFQNAFFSKKENLDRIHQKVDRKN
jgi:hypothetical protein